MQIAISSFKYYKLLKHFSYYQTNETVSSNFKVSPYFKLVNFNYQ